MAAPNTTPKPEAHVATPRPGAEYLFGPFRMELASLRLWHGDTPVPLAPKAFDTLLVLVQQRDRLLLKDELIHAIWSDSFVSEDSLTQNITALRRALGDDPAHPQFIATVPRRGYRFVAPVIERVTAEANDGVDPDAPLVTHVPPQIPGAASPPPDTTSAPRIDGTRRLLWIGVPLLIAPAALALLFLTLAPGRGTPPPGPLRLSVDAPPGTRLLSAVVSADGLQLALVAEDLQTRVVRLWVRPLDSGVARALNGTEGASHPFWSPDRQFIGFFDGSMLKRVGLASGSVQTIAPTVGLTASGGTWSADGVILFAHFRSGIDSVPAAGGAVTSVTTLDAAAGEEAHRWPSILPDGKHFLYSISATTPERSGTYVAALDGTGSSRVLTEVGAIYVPPGYLLYVRQRVLAAQRFDPARLQLLGDPMTIAGDATAPGVTNAAALSASSNGLLVFTALNGTTSGRRMRLVWFNRKGDTVGEVKSPASLSNPTISDDGRRLLAGSGTDVWLIDLDRDVPTKIVPGNTPMLSPDGADIAFTSNRGGGMGDIYVRRLAGGADALWVRTREHKVINDWSRDGKFLVYSTTNPKTGVDLWAIPTAGERVPVPLAVTPANEFQGQISPNGRWLAYASDESGAWEVYVQAFPGGGGKIAVSTGGGSEPQWRRDGRELYYLSADLTLNAVEVVPGESFQVKRAVSLFRTPVPVSGELYARRNHYAVAPDGQRFLINAGDTNEESVAVIAGWTARLPR